MLNHKTRTIWGKVAPLGFNCRGCFQFSRHPKSPWEAANSDQHHHSHITNGCLVMAHIPENPPLPSQFHGPEVPRDTSFGKSQTQAAISHVPGTPIINGSFKENPEILYRKAIWNTLPQTRAAFYLIFFLLPNNLHMKFYCPKGVKIGFICAVI